MSSSRLLTLAEQALKDKPVLSTFMIVIASREREFMIEKETGFWRYLKYGLYRCPLSLMVREKESKNYYDALRNKEDKRWEIPIISVPNEFNLADKRQAMLKIAEREKVDHLIMIDDDIVFSYRDDDLDSKYGSKIEMFEDGSILEDIVTRSIVFCNEKYPMTGFPLRQGANGRKYAYEKNSPIIRYMCFHVPTLLKEEIRFDGLKTPFMSDRYAQLALIDKGYRTITICLYAVDDYGTGYKGGSEKTRTPELQSKSAHNLKHKFPNLVELKTKSNGHWKEERIDCNLKLKRALNEGENPYIKEIEI
jgi:hypothetical protein